MRQAGKKKRARKHVTFAVPDDDESQEKHHEISAHEISIRRSLQGTKDMFLFDYGLPLQELTQSLKYRISMKISDEYDDVKDLVTEEEQRTKKKRKSRPIDFSRDAPNLANPTKAPPRKKMKKSQAQASAMEEDEITQIMRTEVILPERVEENIMREDKEQISEMIEDSAQMGRNGAAVGVAPAGAGGALVKYDGTKGRQVAKITLKSRRHYLKPEWHPPWKLYRVIAGHMGWVEAIAVDVSNEWFCTGSADRTIKIWDLASGKLKLTLTGHISHVRGLKVSPRHPYMFSCGEDKKVLCWDLEQNKVIRSYHGHLSGVYCLDLHPNIDIIFTGGRDSTCRVWDIRTKAQIMLLSGHKHTVHSLACQGAEPQIITGSHDHTVRCWDLKTGKTRTILTHHKKAIRAIHVHPREYTFASGAADNIKIWKCPEASFLRNLNKSPGSIVECLAVNHSNVLVSGHQTGHLKFWDWKTGYNFQTERKPPQPGSLDSECGIAACTFDVTGSRLITCEYDKTIKMWKEDLSATEESHPIDFKPNLTKAY